MMKLDQRVMMCKDNRLLMQIAQAVEVHRVQILVMSYEDAMIRIVTEQKNGLSSYTTKAKYNPTVEWLEKD